MGDEAAAQLEDLADLCTPWCIRVAATLRLADHIAGGVEDIAAPAERTGSDRDALHAVCGHLCRRGVLEEPGPGRFTLTPVGEGLREAGAGRFLALDGIGVRFALAWQSLPAFVRTGRAAYRDVV